MFGLKSTSLFSDTKKLEREIDEFVDILSEVGLVFKSIIPTAENISIYIYNKIKSRLDSNLDLEITLYETPRNFVKYSGI